MSKWKFTVVLEGQTFALLKSAAEYVFKQVADAKHHQQFPIAAAVGGSGYEGNMYSYHCRLETPVDEQIADLRNRADELEAMAKEGKL